MCSAHKKSKHKYVVQLPAHRNAVMHQFWDLTVNMLRILKETTTEGSSAVMIKGLRAEGEELTSHTHPYAQPQGPTAAPDDSHTDASAP